MGIVSKLRRCFLCICCLIFFNLTIIDISSAQSSSGVLKGTIKDGSTNKFLYNVLVKTDTSLTFISSGSDGRYSLQLYKGTYTIKFIAEGFQAKKINGVQIKEGEITSLDIILFPLIINSIARKNILNDSIKNQDSIKSNDFKSEKNISSYNNFKNTDGESDIVNSENIEASIHKNGVVLLQCLSGVVVEKNPFAQGLETINITGLGERYSQVLMNGSLLNSYASTNRSYPFSLIPVESIQNISVQKSGNTAVPADFTSGTIKITLKDLPDNNFFYIRLGGGFSDATNGKDFYEDRKNKGEFFSFPGSVRNLPAEFPTSKSQTSFNDKTAQDKIDLSMKLKNNLAPVNYGKSIPDDKIVLGFGRLFNLRGNKKIGIQSYLQQSTSEIIDNSIVQLMPDVVTNPFPFSSDKILISTQSNDINYRYASQLTGVLNASLLYDRNKISFTNFFGSIFNNTYTSRTQVYKPDEDTLAHNGIYYKSYRQVFFNTQLSGEHALGIGGKFKLTWHASYNYRKEQMPDERNFLLRQDSSDANKFEIAQASAAPFNPVQFSDPNVFDPNLTNSGRLWRNLSENNYEGAVNIAVPFNLLQQSQFISGGIYVEGRHRIFHSDLLPVTGTGYFSLNDLLEPERYSSGDASVRSYFTRFGGSYSYVYANNRGNYDASANIGASYVRLENKFTKRLSLEWGARVESATQLVSNTQYDYVAGDSKPTISPLDKNTFVSKIDFLPSVEAKYEVVNNIQFNAGYFKTVNRPQLQELTSYRYYDPIAFNVTIGNPILQSSQVSNYNAAINWFPKSGTSLSISGFYKKIEQPIENILSSYTTSSLLSQPSNMPSATIYGLTVDFKLRLVNITSIPFLSNFYLFGSGNFLQTKVEAGYVRNLENLIPEHTLSGSSDYAFNTGLIFQKQGLPTITLLYNGVGDYISAIGYGKNITLSNGKNISSIPDYRVKDHQQFDVQVSQKIYKSKIQIVAGLHNLLNNSYIVYQDLNGNKKFDSPLKLRVLNGNSGYYQSGIDNTITNIKSQRNFYFTVSYLF